MRQFFILALLLALASATAPVRSQYRVQKVVIDAGHGGKDPGALGPRTKEKDIALAIALRTGEYITKYLPGVEVIYTRDKDVFIELYRRAKIANEAKADLFISIHCNAARSPSVFGTETYVMGLHRSSTNLDVAKLENAAILKEENYADMYEGFDPNLDEDYITLTMFQHAFLEQSTLLAEKVQEQFRERVKLKDRGVFQAGFIVLYRTTMPGILVETGFITNSKDEAFLNSDDGQAYIASAIFRAVKYFKEESERPDNKAAVAKAGDVDIPEVLAQEILFRVQFLSSRSPKPLDSKKFKGIKDLREYHQDGLYKYTAGNTASYEEAKSLLQQLKDGMKYHDAFIIAFKNGEKIPLDKAIAESGQN